MYMKSQFEAFANGKRQTTQSGIMQPVVAGLEADDIEAVGHYYESIQKKGDGEYLID
jgi:cytochrome c553